METAFFVVLVFNLLTFVKTDSLWIDTTDLDAFESTDLYPLESTDFDPFRDCDSLETCCSEESWNQSKCIES